MATQQPGEQLEEWVLNIHGCGFKHGIENRTKYQIINGKSCNWINDWRETLEADQNIYKNKKEGKELPVPSLIHTPEEKDLERKNEKLDKRFIVVGLTPAEKMDQLDEMIDAHRKSNFPTKLPFPIGLLPPAGDFDLLVKPTFFRVVVPVANRTSGRDQNYRTLDFCVMIKSEANGLCVAYRIPRPIVFLFSEFRSGRPGYMERLREIDDRIADYARTLRHKNSRPGDPLDMNEIPEPKKMRAETSKDEKAAAAPVDLKDPLRAFAREWKIRLDAYEFESSHTTEKLQDFFWGIDRDRWKNKGKLTGHKMFTSASLRKFVAAETKFSKKEAGVVTREMKRIFPKTIEKSQNFKKYVLLLYKGLRSSGIKLDYCEIQPFLQLGISTLEMSHALESSDMEKMVIGVTSSVRSLGKTELFEKKWRISAKSIQMVLRHALEDFEEFIKDMPYKPGNDMGGRIQEMIEPGPMRRPYDDVGLKDLYKLVMGLAEAFAIDIAGDWGLVDGNQNGRYKTGDSEAAVGEDASS